MLGCLILLCFFEGEEIKIAPANTFSDLVKMVEDGEVDTALMAIENTFSNDQITLD